MKKILILMFAAISSIWGLEGAAATDATLGPGDALKISVFGLPDLNVEAKVSEKGTVTFAPVGQVRITGLTPAQAEQEFERLLKAGGYVKDPRVTILTDQLQSQQVSILGQVNKPGRYPIDGKRSITDMLAMAGGINGEGGEIITHVRMQNGIAMSQTIDLIEMLRGGDMKQNLNLSGNDVIYVERAPRFYIYGEVQRPGVYRLERNMTVLQALSAGGGLSPRGTERGLSIKRRSKDGQFQIINVRQDEVINSEDIVYVRESLF